MNIVTWNVNSIRAREERVLAWLDANSPDVLCLQELKGTEDVFPLDAVQERGYEVAIFGQPTYNGVAILSKHPLEDVHRSFGDDVEDSHSRFIAATIRDIRVMNGYFPNGGEIESDKYVYKLAWLERLNSYLNQYDMNDPLLLCGDFNIAPTELDTALADEREGSVLFNDTVRGWFDKMLARGFTDTFRHLHPDEMQYSWWDYRNLSFPKNTGMRIDHILVTDVLKDRLQRVWIDRNERKGKRPSDHVPVLAEFSD
jgi:exodeoxyribonuclease-3